MKLLPTLLALACAAASAPAQEALFALDWVGQAVVVQSSDGQGTALGSSGMHSANSLARDPVSGEIYSLVYGVCGVVDCVGGGAIQRLDPATGLAQPTGAALDAYSASYAYAITPDGAHYALVRKHLTRNDLVRFDPWTGATTLVKAYAPKSISGLCADAAGELWGWSTADGLVHVDKLSGAVTALAPGSGGAHIQGLAFGADGQLWGARDELYAVDPLTGASTAIGPTGFQELRGLVSLSSPAWMQLGGALAGSAGAPQLSGQGPLTGGSSAVIELTQAAPSAPAALVLGGSSAQLPWFGGVLVPLPELALPWFTDAHGSAQLSVPLAAGTPTGVPIYLQAWVADFGAPQGLAASAGLIALTR